MLPPPATASPSKPEVLQDRGVGALAAALAGYEVRRSTEVDAHSDQRGDARSQAVQDADRSGGRGAQHGAGEDAELRSADGGQHLLGEQPVPSGPCTHPRHRGFHDFGLAPHHRGVRADPEPHHVVGGQVVQHCCEGRGHGGVADSDLSESHQAVFLSRSCPKSSATLNQA